MEELKPCPFCGGNNAMVVDYMHQCNQKRYRVVCPECMAMVDAGTWQNMNHAIEAWNTRAEGANYAD